MQNLGEFKKNNFSQFGEDGIISEILKRIDSVSPKSALDMWCVEFGAWDGISGSNTYNLIRNFEYRGVLIEPDNTKFIGLLSNLADSKHYKFNEYVGLDDHNKLDSILGRTEIPFNFDVLSIDIDGMDYFVWKSLQNYRPKIVCIEFNPTIPAHIFFVQPPSFTLSQGSSPMSLVGLAKEKGYELASATDCNLIFVTSELSKLVTGTNHSLEYREIAPPRIVEDVFIFSGYDGTLILSNDLFLPWHNLQVKPLDLQLLPKGIRKFPLNYSFFYRVQFYFFKVRQLGFVWGMNNLKAKIVSRIFRRVICAQFLALEFQGLNSRFQSIKLHGVVVAYRDNYCR